jgi:hypothetical protein
MKSKHQNVSWLAALCALSLSVGAAAQETNQQRSAEDLDTLLAPVALYPDALIAVMLPAATAPADIVLAARYLATGGATNQLDEQAWDDSVRTLAHYPELTQWMSDNLEWTRAVGEAFRAQPADMMAAVQRLRAKAQAVGNLTSTPQQRVVTTQNIITIVPAEPEIIYVPQYDPTVIYVTPAPWGCSWINFGFCWRLGGWHHYDFDWRHCNVRYHERHPHRQYPVEIVRPWHPAPCTTRPIATSNRPTNVPRPQPLAVVKAKPVAQQSATQFQPHTVAKPASLFGKQQFDLRSPATSIPNMANPTREQHHTVGHTDTARDGLWQHNIIRTPAIRPPTIVSPSTPGKDLEARAMLQHTVTSTHPTVIQPQQRTVQTSTPHQDVRWGPTRPEPRTNPNQPMSVRSSTPVQPQPQPRETAVRVPTLILGQTAKREGPRQEIRIGPPSAPSIRSNIPNPPQPQPRVMRTAPTPQPVPAVRAVLTPVPAPQNLRIDLRNTPTVPLEPRTAPALGNLSPGGNERAVGGRGGRQNTRGI